MLICLKIVQVCQVCPSSRERAQNREIKRESSKEGAKKRGLKRESSKERTTKPVILIPLKSLTFK